MKVLSIGNSFSQDAQRYLYALAKSEGYDLQSVNLYIGGCSLEQHYNNLINDCVDYELEINGKTTEKKVSLCEMIRGEKWDYITLQQASQWSAKYETYLPYIKVLADYIRKHCPTAQIYIHETWAYEDDSYRLYEVAKYKSSEMMFADIHSAYRRAFEEIGADGMIPSGTAMMLLAKNYSIKVHRDTFHASLGVGRYLLALVWYRCLTKREITKNKFSDFDEPVSQTEKNAALTVANQVFEKNQTES